MTMAEFASWRSYWDFSHRVKSQNRYFRNAALEQFCQAVLTTGTGRKRRLKEGTSLCRAQKGEYEGPSRKGDVDNEDRPFPFLPERMMPFKDRAMEGRANPKGIPYLYVASDMETAIAESRAGVGESVSVGSFLTVRDLQVADFSIGNDEGVHLYFEEPEAEKRADAVWQDIDRAFSLPLSRSDDAANYVPTQIIAELFKQNGFDGICYRSSLASGTNLVLFDLSMAAIHGCCLYRVTKVKVDYEQAGNPYSVRGGRVVWNTIELVSAAHPQT
jgi:hypothetical protein